MVKRRLHSLRDFTTSCGNAKSTSSILRQSSSKTLRASAARFFARPIRTGLDLSVFSRHKRSKRKFTRNSPGSSGRITQQNGKRPRLKAILAILPGPIQRNLSRKKSQSERSATKKRARQRSEEHTSELQSRVDLVCRLLLEKKKIMADYHYIKNNKKRIDNDL